MRKRKSGIRSFMLLAVFLPGLLFGADTDKSKSWADKPVTSQEIEDLRRQIVDETHSGAEGIFDYHSETGDLNNQLNFWRYGARLNIRWHSGLMLYMVGTHTLYHTLNDYVDESGTNFTLGIRGKPSDHLTVQLEAGGTSFSTSTTTVNALGSITFAPSETTSFYLTGSRTNVEESLLSATGLRPVVGPFAGMLVGNVMENRMAGGVSHKFDSPIDVYADGGFGTRSGSHVDSNFFKKGDGGIGYSLIAGSDEDAVSLLRAGYAFDYFGFDEDLFGFGGASLLRRNGFSMPLEDLGADGISPFPTAFQPGIGGYFSPQRFISNTFRLEIKGRVGEALSYKASAFTGWQSFTGSSVRSASGISGSLTLRLSSHVAIPITYLKDNFGPFTQQTLFIRLATTF